MKEWYLRQSPRDRLIVLIVGGLCLLAGLYLFIVDPLRSGLADRRLQVENKKEDLRYMINGAATLQASGGAAAQTNQRQSDKAPYLLIDQLIRQAKLDLPQRVEPTGPDGARVQFSEVNFDELVKVIAELELYGLNVSTLNISAKNTGTVSARFTMSKS